MRWLVEVMTLGKTERESLHVDAESWQKALQAARAQRGESAPMSGFSIELLDDGCRAVDPMSRVRYEVRRAPGEAGPSSHPPRAASSRPPAVTGPVAVAGPPAAAAPPVASERAPSSAPRPVSQAPHAAKRPPLSASTLSAVIGQGAAAAVQPLAAGPAAPPTAPQEASAPAPPVAPAAPAVAPAHTQPATAPAIGPLPSAAPAPTAPATAAPRTDLGPSVPSQVVFKREHDGTDSVPLTYREYVFLVPSGTSEEAAEALLQAQLELVLASLARVPAGKLVNLGVFDVAFRGKPPVPPLATLMWKDWRPGPIVEFPRRPGYVPHTSAPPPALTAQPMISVGPASNPVPDSSQPARTAAVPLQAAAPALAPPVPAPAVTAAVFAPIPAPVVETPARAQPVAPTPAVAVQEPSATASSSLTDGASASSPPPVVVPTPPSPAAAPAPTPHAGAAPLAQPRTRARGEDLIADLFESMHELHFLRDAVEGGNFCLGLAMEKIPSQAGIVHLYDIDRREFLVTSTRGVAASTLLLRRHSETDALLSAAMNKRRALVFVDASQGETSSLERYVTLGGARSLIVAPVMQAGRFLGAIELLNPLDGQPFTESEGNALTYIAEQFAEFVAARGVVTDPERISSRLG
jgi:GAF domain